MVGLSVGINAIERRQYLHAMKTFAARDRVALSAKFLRSIGCITGEGPFARGAVVSTAPAHSGLEMVEVEWDNGAWPVAKILSCNLTLVSRLAADAAMAR